MIGNALLELYHAGQGAVPARFQLACDEAVLGIGRVILTEGSIGGRALPVDVPLMRAGLQGQPFRTGLAPRPRLGSRTVIAYRDARPAVGVRAAIGWVGDELVKGRVPGTTPFHGAAIDPGRQIKLVLEEPKK